MTPAQPISARVPAPLTPLICRDGRVDAAWQALQGTRLLTLTGTGGGGKTRLAMELASRVERAAWVELAALADPRLIAEHVATTLGVPDRSGQPSLAHIVERFSPHPLLLVLDNCEHVVEAAASLIARLLRECPLMKVLTTSREALGVAGERTLSVLPLSIPRDDTLEAARESDAIALFVERAQDVRAGFELTAKSAPAVARICRRLDGIPLAIELAAARVRALDPEQLAERLESSIGLLETGSRAALPRHRTIRETLDWSHRLLSDDERTLLRRLSVFNGTFALDAVEAVCALQEPPGAGQGLTGGAMLDRVTGLLDKSLLICDAGESGTRYRLLETVREYAAEHLASAGEVDRVRDRHARFCVNLAERAAPAIFGGVGDERWIARLDEDTANMREAQDWCEQQTSRLELSLRLAVALHWYWYARGRFNEGRLRIGIALTFSEGVDPVLRGRALTVLGRLAIWQGDYANVHGPMEEAVALLRPHGDRPSLAYALHGLGIAAALQGRIDDARRLFDEAAQFTESEPPEALSPWIERWRGRVSEWDHDLDGARRAYERALGAARRLGHKAATAHALSALGRLAAASGQLDESVAIFREIEDRWGVAFGLQGLARVAASSGHAIEAASLLGASDALRDAMGVDLSPPLRAYQDATIALAVPHLGEPEFWTAWTGGKNDADHPASLTSAEAPAVAVDLRIRALGAFEAYVRERRVEKTEWGSSRARELLVFIACHPGGCTKAQIGLALWPDASPGQLRNTFHVTMHRLRHALTLPDTIQVDGDRYRLNPALTREFDAELFEREVRAATRDLRPSTGSGRPEYVEGRPSTGSGRPSTGARRPEPIDEPGVDTTAALVAALARYRGDFLAGEPAGEWADERRERLRQLHLEGLDALGRALTEQGRHAEAADAYRALLDIDPVNEEACRRQMICLDRLGDRAGALRAYEALVRAMRDELGVRPGRETAALRDKLVSAT